MEEDRALIASIREELPPRRQASDILRQAADARRQASDILRQATDARRQASGSDQIALNQAADARNWDKYYDQGLTAMHIMAEEGNLDGIELLLARGSQAFRIRGRYRSYPITEAIRAGHLKIVQRLYPLSEPSDHSELVHNAAATWKNGRIEILRWLCELNPALIDSLDAEGTTPLHSASSGCCLECVQYLLRMGADLSILSPDGWNAFHFAAMNEYYFKPNVLKVFSVLLSVDPSGVDLPDKDGMTPFHMAAQRCQPEILEIMLSAISTENIDRPDSQMYTALQWAACESVQDEMQYHTDGRMSQKGLRSIQILRACGASLERINFSELWDPQQHEELHRPLSEEMILDIRYRIYFDRSLTQKLLQIF